MGIIINMTQFYEREVEMEIVKKMTEFNEKKLKWGEFRKYTNL